MNAKNIIDVKNLSASFDDRQILDDVNFSAKEGEITVILGGSGSGKTTILKHLLGLYDTRQGEIIVFEQNINLFTENELLEYYLKIGVFYQNGALLNSLTIGENVALALEQHTMLPSVIIEEMAHAKLELVNLEESYHLYPNQLSGGMLKRAALARAIAMDPPLLFCDEPGAGLDPVSLASLDELLLSLKRQMGMSILMVTHEVSSIRRTADRIVFIDKGKVVFEGSLDEALQSSITVLVDFFNKGTGNN